ncbi:MAG: hypothetical protein SF182_28765 [Deltaproteobacteria bacterium]|nr:hypothetical protein [Deltaproteobacteria bacterium]
MPHARFAILVAALLTVSACGDGSDDATEPGEVVIHDNLMAFLQAPPPSWQMSPPPQPTLSFQFDYDNQYVVSSGQPWQGVSAEGGTPGSPLEVTARAGRHKTDPPAEWFNDRSALLLGYALEDSRPDELYFAFSGTLVINGTSYVVYLGQGGDLLGDDWWLGVPATQPAWTRTSEGYLLTPDGQYIVCKKNGGYLGASSNAFQVIVPSLAENCVEA